MCAVISQCNIVERWRRRKNKKRKSYRVLLDPRKKYSGFEGEKTWSKKAEKWIRLRICSCCGWRAPARPAKRWFTIIRHRCVFKLQINFGPSASQIQRFPSSPGFCRRRSKITSDDLFISCRFVCVQLGEMIFLIIVMWKHVAGDLGCSFGRLLATDLIVWRLHNREWNGFYFNAKNASLADWTGSLEILARGRSLVRSSRGAVRRILLARFSSETIFPSDVVNMSVFQTEDEVYDTASQGQND